ncbi:MAG: hypothetical protein QM598_05625 [Protaetiibacter sp.]
MPVKNRDHASREYLLAHKPAEVMRLEALITEANRRALGIATVCWIVGALVAVGTFAVLAFTFVHLKEEGLILEGASLLESTASVIPGALIAIILALVVGAFVAYSGDVLFNPWGETASSLQEQLEKTDWHKAMALAESRERDEQRQRQRQQYREERARDDQRRLDKLEAAVKRKG